MKTLGKLTAFKKVEKTSFVSALVESRWLLFTFYTAISCVGLLAWCMILKYKIGLRSISEDTVAKSEQSEEERDVEAVSTVPSLSNKSLQEFSNSNTHGCKGITELIQVSLQSFACPRELLWPVVMATVTQITQWSILGTIGEIGAEMCDAQSCSGTSGRFVFRLSLTLSQVLVPGGSLLSSLGTCPRSIFYLLCILQYLSCFAVCAATGGLWRSFWSSDSRASSLHFLICTVWNAWGLRDHNDIQIHWRCRVHTTCQKTQCRRPARHRDRDPSGNFCILSRRSCQRWTDCLYRSLICLRLVL